MDSHWIQDALSHYCLYCGNTYAWIDGFEIETSPRVHNITQIDND